MSQAAPRSDIKGKSRRPQELSRLAIGDERSELALYCDEGCCHDVINRVRLDQSLGRAYMMKEELLDILRNGQSNAAYQMKRWMGWATRSRLKPLARLARTIRDHLDGVLAIINERITNGLAEGVNNKIRLLSHRAHHSDMHARHVKLEMRLTAPGQMTITTPVNDHAAPRGIYMMWAVASSGALSAVKWVRLK
jgi:hypothetical protein